MFSYISWESLSDFASDMLAVVAACVLVFALAALVNRRDREARTSMAVARSHLPGDDGPERPEPGPMPPEPPSPSPQPPSPVPHPHPPQPDPPGLPLPGGQPHPRSESL